MMIGWKKTENKKNVGPFRTEPRGKSREVQSSLCPGKKWPHSVSRLVNPSTYTPPASSKACEQQNEFVCSGEAQKSQAFDGRVKSPTTQGVTKTAQ